MSLKLKQNELLKNHTTFKVGGQAKYFFEAKTIKDLINSIKYARHKNIPFFILGNGSNILISDQGYNGLIIKNSSSTIKLLTNNQVKLDSGVFLPKAIFFLIEQGLTGLESFAGIPATIGGAVYMNIHGHDKFFSDYLISATLLDQNNQVKEVSKNYFNFKYDYSKLHDNNHILLSVTLKLIRQSSQKAKLTTQEQLKSKSHYPQISAGCIFQNLSQNQQKKLNLPTPSTGYVIDKVLNLKGTTIGQAKISDKHAGFIENLGNAKADDIIKLINLIKKTAKDKLDLDLKLEIQTLGF
ncbi:MAG: UDP-N-acetylmuramate dehydrogenase [Patescibacteria group bacterium]|nr:UDP-N-acetylmuramate dehydrogenase [Patescibacteria group bacterium]